ncbi:tRNA (cytidine(34)-2'-O)-methyltransferase [Bremerella cremea]|uniref:Putative tRNA (cytidine(34)-2'-O)-methyltransferase n=1 Tax=Blastopirellula marina TaxID=124 RepID=A0A2S8FZP6_9BACT|nr:MULTISPECIES: tRNA (cytidine(34)-2'-O)-methyltransferase [Pirellulaceae]PQO37653.1 tRNA (uridine(34)/cytosine(34)/5-carboxymethylaminomethyluridine(34)-2'-O)-methyltransferase TrmL [Blastopirellula marina]RCS50040.1 tRNA (cytidine(34)-2'-O)-methyltransferase [Bremerella cremea]
MYDPVLHIVLLEPEIPPNTGNIGRTCVATGIKLWLVEPLGFQVDDTALKRAGMDYWQHLNWEVVPDWDTLTKSLKGNRWWYLTKTAKTTYTDIAFEKDDVLVFGRESAGLPRELVEANEKTAISVPMRTDVRSLNLASTASVVAYEAVRQLTVRGEYSLPIGESPIG